MEDPQIHGSIDRMVAEEHELWQREAAGKATDGDRERLGGGGVLVGPWWGLPRGGGKRLDELRVSLDQCWDLLRQRRARREAGQRPDGAELRPSEVVERYQQ